MELRKEFEGEKSVQYNAMLTALHECGHDFMRNPKNPLNKNDTDCYYWLEKTGKNIMVQQLVDKLNDLGFSVVENVTNK